MMLNDKFVAEQSSPFLTRFSARWFPSSIPFLSFFPFDLPFIAETATIARFFINRYSFCFLWASATLLSALLSALERKCSAQLSSALTVSHSTIQRNSQQWARESFDTFRCWFSLFLLCLPSAYSSFSLCLGAGKEKEEQWGAFFFFFLFFNSRWGVNPSN